MNATVEWKLGKVTTENEENTISASFVAQAEGLNYASVLMKVTDNGDVQIQAFDTSGTPNPVFQKTIKYDPDKHRITISD